MALLVLLLMTAGCTGAGTPITVPAATPPAAGAAPSTDSLASATASEGSAAGIEAPGEPRYSCGGPPGFAPSLFDQPAIAELEDHPSAAALRAAIAKVGPDIDMLPPSGYWLVHRDDQIAEYLARNPAGADTDFVFASTENQGGVWKNAGWGGCRPEIVLDGLSLATWTLDPDLPAPHAKTTTVTTLVMERMCASGQAMGGRLQPPSITYGQDSVVVVFAAIPPGGDFQTCQSNPAMRAVVELREPLGDRQLLDGAFFPPAAPDAPAL